MTSPISSSPAPALDQEVSFQLLFHQHPLPMWVVDQQSLAFLAVNEAAIRLYGYSLEEFLGMTMDQFAEADPDAAEPVRESSGGPAPVTRWRHRRKDGSILEVECSWHEIPFVGHEAVLVLTMDRTAQRQAEERNREQARLLDLASDAILVRDLKHRVLYWNRGAERLYGWSAEEMLGQPVVETLVVDKEAFLGAQVALLESGEFTGQFNHKTRDGRTRVVSSRLTLVRDAAGKPHSVLEIDTDLTETKKLEAQFLRAQRQESIGTLASGIAHDLNNILSPILMSVSLLRRNLGADSDAEKMLNIIESSAERGAGIVKQVLTFARGVEGERVLLQPRHLISELAKIMAQTFPRNIDIQTVIAADLWTVSGDATQLHQVLLNLCVNARDAMPEGGTLTVGAENVIVDEQIARMNPGAQLGPHVVLRATDTGTGMSPETMEKIFDPFFTTKELGKGTGLGLATVMGIVKSHGGFLNLQSEIGIGTTFRIYLPASREAQEGEAAKEVEVRDGAGERILVVDDEPPIREALVGTLVSHGYQAYTAEDGSDALALYFQRRDEIDLVLTDLSMGQMDGISLVRSLRKINPGVRVIVSSGHMTKESMVVLNSLGVTTFLDKPYNAEKLLRALRAMLNEPTKVG